MGKVKIMCVCGTGIATSTVVHNGVANICKRNNIEYEIIQCKSLEVKSKLNTFSPDLIVSTTTISTATTIPIISGIAFLSGVGLEKVEEQIIAALKQKLGVV